MEVVPGNLEGISFLKEYREEKEGCYREVGEFLQNLG
jgi:hypothetical protein